MVTARRFVIAGRVQGVGYRFFTQRAAARHQVLGYVRNCDDGSVEVHAEGDEKAVSEFRLELQTGPVYAIVSEIEELVLDPTGLYSSFRIEK